MGKLKSADLKDVIKSNLRTRVNIMKFQPCLVELNMQ